MIRFQQLPLTLFFMGLSVFTSLLRLKNARILSPRNAATKTPAKPPSVLAVKMVPGCRPNAKPAGIAAYTSNVARPATVRISSMDEW